MSTSISRTQACLSYCPVSAQKRRLLDEQIVRMVYKEFHPFSIVEDNEFRALLKLAIPGYQVPSRKTLSNSLIPSMYEENRLKIKQELAQVSSVSLTADGWTSINKSFFALTAHFLSEPNLRCVSLLLLCCSDFSERHTAENVAERVKNCTDEWGISNKISCVVTDNGANMKAAIHLLNWCHVSCFAHSLNLLVKKGLEEINETLNTVESIVQFFKQSAHASSKLEQTQTQMKLPVLKLKQDFLTRWNSTFDMLTRFMSNNESILVTCAILELGSDKFSIEASDGKLLVVVLVLEYFNLVTEIISAEKFVTISRVILLFQFILQHIHELEDLPPKVSQMRESIDRELNDRFYSAEKNVIVADATLLDPRYKKFGFSIDKRANEAITDLKTRLQQRVPASTSSTDGPSSLNQPEVTNPNLLKFFNFLNKKYSKSSGQSSTPFVQANV